jgi:cleavage and polyadenylation specificity factor subunit 1
MSLFSKGRARMEVIAAEFLPHGKHLFILVADAESNLHVLQYDPERKSLPFILLLSFHLENAR